VALSTPLTPKEEKGQSTDKTWPLSNFKQQLGKENKQTNKPKRDRAGGGRSLQEASMIMKVLLLLSLSLSWLSSSPSFSCKLKCKIIYLPVLKFLVFSCCFCSIMYLYFTMCMEHHHLFITHSSMHLLFIHASIHNHYVSFIYSSIHNHLC
jgi:hypothetical protein